MGDTLNVQDANFIKTKALPNGANTVYSSGLDLGALSDRGARVAEIEFKLSAPALATAALPDTKTIKYSVQTDSDSAFGSPTDLMTNILTQTGASGAGAAAATKRFRLPTDSERYVRIKAINDGTGDASGSELTLEAMF